MDPGFLWKNKKLKIHPVWCFQAPCLLHASPEHFSVFSIYFFAHKICSRSLWIKTTQRARPKFWFFVCFAQFLPTILSSHSRSANGPFTFRWRSLLIDEHLWLMFLVTKLCSMLLAAWSYSVTPAWNRLSLYWDHSQLLGSRTCVKRFYIAYDG